MGPIRSIRCYGKKITIYDLNGLKNKVKEQWRILQVSLEMSKKKKNNV